MTRLTTKTVNKALAKAGCKLALHQGRGYLYFAVLDECLQEWLALDGAYHDTHKVDICWLNHLTLEQWLDRAKDANAVIRPAA